MTTPTQTPLSSASERQQRTKARMRTLHRVVLMGCAVFVPLYLAIRLTGGSTAKLQELPDLLDRLKTPMVVTTPAVKYLDFYHGPPSAQHKFVLVQVRLEARMKIGYPVVPHCFELVDDDDLHHYPMSRSPLFIHQGVEFRLDRDDTVEDELLFEIPVSASAERLTFERYQPE